LNFYKFKRVRREIDDVLGSRTDVQFEDLNKLEYTSCVLKEVLRLHPPAAIISRYTTKNTMISGLEVPKNTWITVS
jgi:cytochrome P450